MLEEPIDPYLPLNGNRGYRVSRYELELTYKVFSNRLAGKAVITAVTTESRSKFSFDLAQNLQVSKVSVNGARGTKYAHLNNKLILTPSTKIPAGGALSVTIAYSGNPEPIKSLWGEVGWEELDEGTLVASQPNGAASWFPCDDHPISKASYRISITTDSPFYALANGKLIRKQTRASQTTWVYEQTEPMATYLATIQIGQYEHRQVSAGPVPVFAVHPPRLRAAFDVDFGRQPQMLEVFGKLFGPYPFTDYTAVVTDDELEIPIEAQDSRSSEPTTAQAGAVPNVLSHTSLPINGSATASLSGSGATSGCTKALPVTRSGSGPRIPVARPRTNSRQTPIKGSGVNLRT